MRTVRDKRSGKSRGRSARKRGLMKSMVCASCGRKEKVPFVPRKGMPVFCRECMRKRSAY